MRTIPQRGDWHLASGVNFDKQGSDKHGNTVGVLVADANRESIMKHVYAGNRLPVIGFSNNAVCGLHGLI